MVLWELYCRYWKKIGHRAAKIHCILNEIKIIGSVNCGRTLWALIFSLFPSQIYLILQSERDEKSIAEGREKT